MRAALLFAALLLSATSAALAQDFPASSCARPDAALIKPPDWSARGNWAAADSYNAKVKLYNGQAQDYAACTRAYVDGAIAERDRIQRDANGRIRQITDEANARLKQVSDVIASAQQDANLVAAQEAVRHEAALTKPQVRQDPRAAIHSRKPAATPGWNATSGR